MVTLEKKNMHCVWRTGVHKRSSPRVPADLHWSLASGVGKTLSFLVSRRSRYGKDLKGCICTRQNLTYIGVGLISESANRF